MIRIFFMMVTALIFQRGAQLNAQPTEVTRKLDAFENISVETSDHTNVFIQYDKTPRVVIKTDAQYIKEIETTVSNQTLKIYFDADELGDAKVEVYVYLPRVTKVSIVGGGSVEVLDGVNPRTLQTSITGGGQMLFKERVDVVSFESSVTGGGSIDALKLQIAKAQISVSGGGKVLVQVKDELKGMVNGGGDILYEGDPRVFSDINGGGRVKPIKN